MAALPDLQQGFAAAVLEDDPAFARHVAAGRFPPERLLQVYRHNVFASLTAALAAVYPAVQRLVGEGFFRYAADGYIRRHPPASGNLHDYGGRLAEFLADFEPARALAYLPDVARLEWAWHEAYHADDAPGLSLERLATVPAEQHGALRFRLHPSARLLASPWPILRIWQANQQEPGDEPPVDLTEGGVRLLIHRRGLEIEIEPLAPGDHALLAAFGDGAALAPASEAALAADPAFDLAARLRHHVLHRTVADFT
jgi:hypothetical protein